MNSLDFLPSVCHRTLDERSLLLWQRRTLPHTAHKSKKCDSSNPTADTITNLKCITHKKQIIALCLPNKCKYWFSNMGCDETLPRQKLFQTYRMRQWMWGGTVSLSTLLLIYTPASLLGRPPLGHSWLGYIYRAESKTAHGVQECLATEAEGWQTRRWEWSGGWWKFIKGS